MTAPELNVSYFKYVVTGIESDDVGVVVRLQVRDISPGNWMLNKYFRSTR